MLTCLCTLAGTVACKSCPTFKNYVVDNDNYFKIPAKTKITEKYEDGKLVERIIEEA